MSEQKLSEVAQKVQKTVEEWADGCDHTHDEPEDCEACTEEMLRQAFMLVGTYFKSKKLR